MGARQSDGPASSNAHFTARILQAHQPDIQPACQPATSNRQWTDGYRIIDDRPIGASNGKYYFVSCRFDFVPKTVSPSYIGWMSNCDTIEDRSLPVSARAPHTLLPSKLVRLPAVPNPTSPRKDAPLSSALTAAGT